MFKLVRSELPRPIRTRLIKNSEVIKPGDAIVDEATGAANVDGTGEYVLGIATKILNNQRIPLDSPSCSPTTYDGTFDASTGQYTATSDNQTDKMVLVEYVEVREGDEVDADLSAAKGSTTGSNKAGYNLAINTSDSGQLDETTASTSNSSTQFRITDPLLGGSTTKVRGIFTKLQSRN